jgi:hypothetical protein
MVCLSVSLPHHYLSKCVPHSSRTVVATHPNVCPILHEPSSLHIQMCAPFCTTTTSLHIQMCAPLCTNRRQWRVGLHPRLATTSHRTTQLRATTACSFHTAHALPASFQLATAAKIKAMAPCCRQEQRTSVTRSQGIET